jgi:uncharacterized membrane protein YkvA (DUF1232 family)
VSNADQWSDAAKQAVLLVPNLIKLYGRLMSDRRVPLRARALAMATLGYTALPIDIVPDFIPVLGQIDDVVIVALGLRRLAEVAGPELLSEHWDGEEPVLESVQAVVEAVAAVAPHRIRRLLQWAAPL